MSYNPSIGRFMERDPLGYVDGMNEYELEKSNPITGLDPSGTYDIGGHYYTVYAVAVAAGLNKTAAQRLAYYAQYPDIDPVLDPVKAGEQLIKDSDTRAATGTGSLSAQERQWNEDVQQVLHSIHGGNPEEVNKRRSCLEKLLSEGKLTNMEKGLLIHALGDAYAHTHMINGEEFAFASPLGHALAGSAPDTIALAPGTYKDYVNSLFDSIGGNRNNPAQIVMLNAIIANASILPHNVKEEADAMNVVVSGTMFGLTDTYKPGLNKYHPVWAKADKNQVMKLIEKIKAACNCK